jgi:signal transduction histidine kinase
MGDESRVLRVFNNLFKNAQQAFVADRRGKISVHLSSEGNNILISVSDNGSGVPEDVQRRIFQPNFTTKSSGTGLGLAMVKNILTEMGGKISFESKAGEGTTFFIELPGV